MNARRRFFGAFALLLSSAAMAAPPEDAAAEVALLKAVNDYRAARGLARWLPDPGLAAIAREHSRRMQAQAHLSHEGFRARALRSGSDRCVENLVHGARAPEVAIAAWRRSAAHHDNLLDPGVRWAGVGVAGPYATLLACATPAPAIAPAASAPSS